MIRRALVLLVLAVAVLLVVADRLTEQAAAHALSVRARQTGLLADDPTVSIRGFPFLTQAFRGRYQEIDVTTHGIHRGGLRLDTVIGRFRGLHVGLAAALDGKVGAVPVDHASGEVEITYADLDAYLAKRRLRLAPSGAAIVVSGTAAVTGKKVAVSGPVTPGLADGTLTLTPVAGGLRGPAGALPTATARALAALFEVRVPLASLPFGLRLQTVAVSPTGLTLTAVATGLVVAVPADAAVP